MKLVAKLSVFALAALLSSSCNRIVSAFMPTVSGDGNITTENRQTDAFKSVGFEGSYVVVLTQGPTQEIRIETDKNLLSHITTTVSNGELKVKSEDNLSPTKSITVYITNPTYNDIASAGSSKISATTPIKSDDLKLAIAGSGNYTLEVHTPKLATDISGSGTMNLSGDATAQKIDVAGSGTIKAANLTSESATIDIAGSGDAFINASKSINASISGSGRVKYSGTASDIHTDISGSGKIERAQ
jgi:hypothetical protein